MIRGTIVFVVHVVVTTGHGLKYILVRGCCCCSNIMTFRARSWFTNINNKLCASSALYLPDIVVLHFLLVFNHIHIYIIGQNQPMRNGELWHWPKVKAMSKLRKTIVELWSYLCNFSWMNEFIVQQMPTWWTINYTWFLSKKPKMYTYYFSNNCDN